MHRLFESFESDAHLDLLFLKNLEKIEVHEKLEGGCPRLRYKVRASVNHGDKKGHSAKKNGNDQHIQLLFYEIGQNQDCCCLYRLKSQRIVSVMSENSERD